MAAAVNKGQTAEAETVRNVVGVSELDVEFRFLCT